jgi:cytochrome P450
MQPAFTAEALAGFVPQIVAITERYLSSWAAAPGAVAGQEQLKLLTFEIILQVRVQEALPAIASRRSSNSSNTH